MKHAYNILLILITLIITPYIYAFSYSEYSTKYNIDSATYDIYDDAILLAMNPGSTTGTELDDALAIKYASGTFTRFDKIGTSSYLNVSVNLQDSSPKYHQKAIFWGGTTRYLTGVAVIINGQCGTTSKCAIYKYDNVNNRWSQAYSYAAGTSGDYYDGFNWYPYSIDYCQRLQAFDQFDSNSAINKLLSYYSTSSVKFCGGTCNGCPIASTRGFLGTMSYSSMTELLLTRDTIYKAINGTFGQPIMTDRYKLEINNSLTSTNPDVCVDARKGVYFPQDNKIYCIDSSGTDIGVVLNATNQSATDYLLSTQSTSCQSILAAIDTATAIECRNPQNCMIGGYHASAGVNYADLAYFDGSECLYIEDGSSGYTTYNKTIYDIEYDPSTAQYILVGDRMFAEVSQLSYNVTIPPEIPLGEYDGYYHDYCHYNIACHDYNVSSGICEDEVQKWCDLSPLAGVSIFDAACGDTFDTYVALGLQDQITTFSAQCYNDSYVYKTPTIEGQNSTSFLDYCIGSYLCHHYNISYYPTYSATCPPMWDGAINKVYCLQNNIYGSCVDNRDLYNNIEFYPPQLNFTGACQQCVANCQVENETICGTGGFNTTVINKCLRTTAGCLQVISIQTCPAYCSYGFCTVIPPAGGAGGGVSNASATRSFLDGLFPPGSSYTDRMLYCTFIIIATVLLIIVLMGAANMMYDIGVSAGVIAGIAVVAAIAEFLTFAFMGYYPAWLMIVFFIITAGIVALLIKSVVVQ